MSSYIYMGFIPKNQVVRIPKWDVAMRFQLLQQGWVYTTKEAYNIKQKFGDSVQIFKPTTHAGVQILSHVHYTAQQINALKTISNKNK